MTSQSTRLIRIFISSTFRDFLAERDELVKKVFPELRRRCRAHHIEILEVDLRWGVTEEQSQRGETLRICLDEIDRCRPSAPVYFIGLLGERYGWIPPVGHFPEKDLDESNLAWIRSHLGGTSVTELEIHHGVLNNQSMTQNSLFYFRRNGYEKRHWDTIHREYIDLRPEDFTNESAPDPAWAVAKQERLKQVISSTSLEHPPRIYETPTEMARFVLADLWTLIESTFPLDEEPDELERHRLEHALYSESLIKGYLPRSGLFGGLDEILSAEGPPIRVVTGESGSGKSALIAAWLKHADSRLPRRTFVNYVGAVPGSSSARDIVWRLMESLRSWGSIPERVPETFEDQVMALPAWLGRVAATDSGGLLIVLDALDKLQNAEDMKLWWLPKSLPDGVRLIASTLTCEAKSALRERQWLTEQSELQVEGLVPAERKEIIRRYLAHYAKALAEPLIERLSTPPQTSNALFLKVVLDELRTRAKHEDLEQRITRMLEAKNPAELYEQILQNLAEFNTARPNLVRDAMSYLHLAKRGLAESELLQLLSDHSEPASSPLARHVWSPLFLALDGALLERNGRLSFSHDYLHQAVQSQFLKDPTQRIQTHKRFCAVTGSWDSERFSPSLRRYALSFGSHHARMAHEFELLEFLYGDPQFTNAQEAEFGGHQEIRAGLEEGILAYTEGNDCKDDRDASLCRLACLADHFGAQSKNAAKLLIDKLLKGPRVDFPGFVDAFEKIFAPLSTSESATLAILARSVSFSGPDLDVQKQTKDYIISLKSGRIAVSQELVLHLSTACERSVEEILPKSGSLCVPTSHLTFCVRDSIYLVLREAFPTVAAAASAAADQDIDGLLDSLDAAPAYTEDFVRVVRAISHREGDGIPDSTLMAIIESVSTSPLFEGAAKASIIADLKTQLSDDEDTKISNHILKICESGALDKGGYQFISGLLLSRPIDFSRRSMARRLLARCGHLSEALNGCGYLEQSDLLEQYLLQQISCQKTGIDSQIEDFLAQGAKAGRSVRDTVEPMLARVAMMAGHPELARDIASKFWRISSSSHYYTGFCDEEDHAQVAAQAARTYLYLPDEEYADFLKRYLDFDDLRNFNAVSDAFVESIITRADDPFGVWDHIHYELTSSQRLKCYQIAVKGVLDITTLLKAKNLDGIRFHLGQDGVLGRVNLRSSGIVALCAHHVLNGRIEQANAIHLLNPGLGLDELLRDSESLISSELTRTGKED